MCGSLCVSKLHYITPRNLEQEACAQAVLKGRSHCVLKKESIVSSRQKAVSLRKKALSLHTLRYDFVAALHRAPKTAQVLG